MNDIVAKWVLKVKYRADNTIERLKQETGPRVIFLNFF